MSLTLDHAVILVKDLEQAVADYTRLGFQVTPGGEHTDGATHNALIAFADGTYLELIAFKRAAPEHRWWPYTRRGTGEGLIDFALLPTDISLIIREVNQRGLNYTGPFDGGRLRPDGQQLRWQTGLPPSTDLPFLIVDVTPRDLRVPSGPAHRHPNGVTGVKTIQVAPDQTPAEARQSYQALFGLEEQNNPTDTATFPIGSSFIEIASSPGLFLTAPHQTEVDPALTHGVSLQIG